MSMFRYLKTPDIILSLVSSKKLDWTHTVINLITVCAPSNWHVLILTAACIIYLVEVIYILCVKR